MSRKQFFQKAYRRYMDGELKEFTIVETKDEKTGRTVFKTSDGVTFFTQDHMNTEIGNARKDARAKMEKEQTELQKTLEAMKKEAEEKGMNVDALSAKIKELEEANLTADQLTERRLKDLETGFAAKEKALQDQVAHFAGMFREERITTEITNACTAHKAVSTETLAPLIRANTELVEEKDRKGATTGYKVVVHFPDRDEENKPVVRDLSVSDAVKRMREMTDRFGHLFLHESEPGSGQSTLHGQSEGAGNGPLPENATQEQYNAWAEKQGFGQ